MPPTQEQLLKAAQAFFNDLGANRSSADLLHYFSDTDLIRLSHSPVDTYTFPLTGIQAVRSYFDLLSTHWTRDEINLHNISASVDDQQVIVNASVKWKWKYSGRSWTEAFTCTLDYDECLRIKAFIVQTNSAPETCVMRAVDPGRSKKNHTVSRFACLLINLSKLSDTT